MNKTQLTYSQKLNLISRIGDEYRSSVRRLDVADASGRSICGQALRDDYEMKKYTERALADCTAATRLIATRDFLEISDRNWYVNYFSKSQYYRLKHRAVDEFLHCLQIA